MDRNYMDKSYQALREMMQTKLPSCSDYTNILHLCTLCWSSQSPLLCVNGDFQHRRVLNLMSGGPCI
ncbi:hypothetical protein AMELA_G00229560 [Ameiurus melas]|uniref:Uncharacterized protein n=1 Tax=Ameiurus melas TaxID=219545 RepID=A0A7J5ZZ93_AMEME|nr:hypothetical protein AMELA_G00229560 [Ameiurus melas]